MAGGTKLQLGRAPTQARFTTRPGGILNLRSGGDFVYFTKLPVELQLKIWSNAFEEDEEDDGGPWLCVSINPYISNGDVPDITFTFHKDFLPDEDYLATLDHHTLKRTLNLRNSRSMKSFHRDKSVHAACAQSRLVYLQQYSNKLPIDKVHTCGDALGRGYIRFKDNTRVFICNFMEIKHVKLLNHKYFEYDRGRALPYPTIYLESKLPNWPDFFSSIKHLAIPSWMMYCFDTFRSTQFLRPRAYTVPPFYAILGMTRLETCMFADQIHEESGHEYLEHRGEKEKEWTAELERFCTEFGKQVGLKNYKGPKVSILPIK